MMSLGACSWLVNQEKTPKIEKIDLCKTDLKLFVLDEEEFAALKTPNKKNAALLNCLLAVQCGAPLTNKKICEN